MRPSGRGRSERTLARAFAILLLALLASCDRASASTAAIATTSPIASASDSVPALSAVPSASQSPAAVDAVVAAAAPYDLAADLSVRTGLARADFGATTPVSVEGTVFLLVSADHGPQFAPSVSLAHDALEAFFDGRFRERPERAVTVYIFSTKKAFDDYVGRRFRVAPGDFLGFYRRSTREILVDASQGRTTLTHEMIHPLVEADFARAPAWIDEGIGSLFEAPVLPRPGEIHGVKNWRYPRLRAAIDSPRERDAARLDALFGMSNQDFVSRDRDLHYAMARFACQWLDSRGLLWPFYSAFRDGFADDPTGEKTFERVVGQTPAQANDAWTKWLRAL